MLAAIRKNPDVLNDAYRHVLALAYGTTIFLSGCVSMSGIHPQAQLKEGNTLEAGKTIASAAPIAWPHEDWWKAYHDPQLDALIAAALKDSPTLHMAQARTALAKSYAESAHAETLPNVGGDASFTRERFTALQFIPPPWAGSSDWNNMATVSMAYDLDLWGRQEHLWKGSVSESRAAEAEAQQVKLELVTAIVRTYVQLSMEYALHDVAEARQAQIEKRVSIARRGLAAGLGTGLEVSEIEAFLPLEKAQIYAIDGRVALLKNQLAALSGQGPGAGDRIVRPAIALDAPVGLPDQLPANLIGRRPDVLAHRWHVEASMQNIESAKAAFYPNINLLAFVGFQALGFGQLISNAAAIGGVGPAISLPIFDGGRRRSNLSAKTAGYDIAVENYNGVVVHALQDVSDQLAILGTNAKQQAEVERSLALAQKTHDLAQESYRAGIDNYQHVLNTQTAVLKQRETLAQLQAVRLEGHAELMRALGGGAMDELIQSAAAENGKP